MTSIASARRTDPVRVAPHERDVIAVARALFGSRTSLAIEPILAGASPVEKLSPTAMSLLQSTLARGSVHMLARLGGSQARLRPGVAKPTRVFDARPVPVIAFGPWSFELVRWLASVPLDDRSAPDLDQRRGAPETIGDELLAYLTLRLVAGSRFERRIAAQVGVRASSLAWLGHARALARYARGDDAEPPSFDGLLAQGEGRLVVECLVGDLASQWKSTAHWSRDEPCDPPEALRIATAERRTLESFLDALERQGRWDLGTFLVDAGAALLGGGSTTLDLAARAAPPVRAEGPLRIRTEARRRSGAVYHALARIGARREHLSLVRFFEDGYDDAQSLLTTWEVLGRDGFSRAGQATRALDALEVPMAETRRDE
jgi:hypothetical protein